MGTALSKNNLIFHWLISQLNVPYIYGGDDPMSGLDCSGLVINMLNSFGYKLNDMTSAQLYEWCKHSEFHGSFDCGAIAFYGKDKISHVGIMINRDFIVEAGGGDATTTDIKASIKRNAYVRIRPLRYRNDLVSVFLPKWDLNLSV
jgi:cell wall-associated NlpC family hydrolase